MTFVSVASAVAIFIYGMTLLSSSMKKNTGELLENVITKFTSNRFSSLLTGSVFTSLLQSSTACSVMTVSLVDSGKLKSGAAYWIIVGANIGSVFTNILTAMEFSDIAPLFMVAGVVLMFVSKKEKIQNLSIALIGFGLLFVGMNTMSSSLAGLRNSPCVLNILSSCSSAMSGILCGAVVTGIIQSSAAVTAVLQTLAAGNLIDLRQAYFISLGANIGTCLTSAVACIGTNTTAKKVSAVHFLFNVYSALLFSFLCIPVDFPELIQRFVPTDIKKQIAFINLLFNVVPALSVLFMPLNTMSKLKNKCFGFMKSIPRKKEKIRCVYCENFNTTLKNSR